MMVWKCPPLHLPNWNNLWKWKEQMNNEPVAWINKTGSHGYLEWDKDDEVDESIPLYTHPAELTDEEIILLWNDLVERVILRKASEK